MGVLVTKHIGFATARQRKSRVGAASPGLLVFLEAYPKLTRLDSLVSKLRPWFVAWGRCAGSRNISLWIEVC